MLTAGAKRRDVEAQMRRYALDDWLDAPFGVPAGRGLASVTGAAS